MSQIIYGLRHDVSVGQKMLKHFRNQRNISRVVLASQLLLAVAAGLIGSIAGAREQGLAFALGAAILALAHFAMSVLAFAGPVQSAPGWFGRFMLAVLLKWALAVVLMLLFMRYLAAAPLMALSGVVVSLAVIQLFNLFDAKVKRGS
ncbi:MAG TPA: hypothetical protein VN248_04615 [Arenimonas sp.]|nr:hypothetical protein [Arenimonas sp.]